MSRRCSTLLSLHLLPKRDLDPFLQNGMKGKYRAKGLFWVRLLTDLSWNCPHLCRRIKYQLAKSQISLWFQREVWAPVGQRKSSGFGSVPQLMSGFILQRFLCLHTFLPSELHQNWENIRDPQQTQNQFPLHLGCDLTVEKLWILGQPCGKTEPSWAWAG